MGKLAYGNNEQEKRRAHGHADTRNNDQRVRASVFLLVRRFRKLSSL